MRIVLLSGLFVLSGLASLSVQAMAPAALATAPGVHQLQTVVVSGIQPGPGLWKVSKGDNVLWILGTVAPVPKRMEWFSPKTESVLSRAQEIIGQPGVTANMSVGNMFKAAFAMPTILRARKNPDGKRLQDVLPADLYARWLALKATYLGKNKDVEEWRPIFAAGELYQAALDRADLGSDSMVHKRIGQLAEKRKIKWTSTVIKHQIKDPKRLAKSFAKEQMDEVACFRSLLDRLELDVAHAAEEANAWAVGDVQQLSRLARKDNMVSCFEVIAKTEAFRSLGMEDASQRSEAQWFQAVDVALAANHTSFATMPVRKLLQADGMLAKLQAKGYTVAAPE